MDDSQPTSWLTTRAAAITAIAAACVLTAVLLCGNNLLPMLSVACFDGMAAAAWVGGAAALGAVVLRAARVPVSGPLRVATAGGLGLGLFSLVGLGLGLAGALNRPVALAFPIIGYGLLITDLWRRGVVQSWHRSRVVGWLRRPAGAAWVWGVPAVSLTMAVVAAGVLPGVLWKPLDPHPYDVTSYHLEVPREWYAAGRIARLDHNLFSCFPMNAEVQSLLLMHASGAGPLAPWRAMYAAQFVSVGYTLLMLLAVAGATDQRVPLRGDRYAGAIAAAVAAAVPWVVMLAGVAYVESALLLYTALTVAWTMRATEPSGSAAGSSTVRVLAVAGVFAGLAAGVKITAVPMLVLAVPIATAAARAMPWRRWATASAVFGLVAMLVVAPWLVRTAVWTHGNPVWPVGMSTLGAGGFSPAKVERFRVAHSPQPAQRSLSGRAGVLWRDVVDHWQYGYVLLPAAAVALALRWRDRQTAVLAVVAGVTFVVWVGFTHLLPRFLVPLVPVAAIAVGRASAGRRWPACVAVAVVMAAVGWVGTGWAGGSSPGVGPTLAEWTRPDERAGLFGPVDLTAMAVDATALTDAIATGKQVALVGDAQAFFFQVPTDHLHYRTVFDLPADAPGPVAAWAGPAAVGNADYLLIINPAEIARLHATYVATPALPAEWAARGSKTFLLPGDQVTTETRRHGEEKKEN